MDFNGTSWSFTHLSQEALSLANLGCSLVSPKMNQDLRTFNGKMTFPPACDRSGDPPSLHTQFGIL